MHVAYGMLQLRLPGKIRNSRHGDCRRPEKLCRPFCIRAFDNHSGVTWGPVGTCLHQARPSIPVLRYAGLPSMETDR